MFTVKSFKPPLEYMSQGQYTKLENAEQGTNVNAEIDQRANASAATKALTVGERKKAGRGGATKRGQLEAGYGGGWCAAPPPLPPAPCPLLALLWSRL